MDWLDMTSDDFDCWVLEEDEEVWPPPTPLLYPLQTDWCLLTLSAANFLPHLEQGTKFYYFSVPAL